MANTRGVYQCFFGMSQTEHDMNESDACQWQRLPVSFCSKDSRTYTDRKSDQQESTREPGDRYVTRSVVLCTPEIYESEEMTAYIQQQTENASKQWIYDVLQGTRENDQRLVDTSEFVMLPDTEAPNTDEIINWLAIFRDTKLKSIRSLTAEHLPLLRRCKQACMDYITRNTAFASSEVLAYFHYLPSVFQLHVHFCAPYGQYTTLDICKIQSIDNVISNLEIDGDYYRKARITTVVLGRGELNRIYNPC